MSQFALERFGLAFTSATPSIALFAGSIGALVGARTRRRDHRARRRSRCSAARCSVPAYEVFYTPIPLAEKRAAKSIIDVGFDRVGDAVGGGAIRFILTAGAGGAALRDHRV